MLGCQRIEEEIGYGARELLREALWEADVMRWMGTLDRYDLMLAVAVFFFVLTITIALV